MADPQALIDRLTAAQNAHDLEGSSPASTRTTAGRRLPVGYPIDMFAARSHNPVPAHVLRKRARAPSREQSLERSAINRDAHRGERLAPGEEPHKGNERAVSAVPLPQC